MHAIPHPYSPGIIAQQDRLEGARWFTYHVAMWPGEKPRLCPSHAAAEKYLLRRKARETDHA
jgi:hypothetical protein